MQTRGSLGEFESFTFIKYFHLFWLFASPVLWGHKVPLANINQLLLTDMYSVSVQHGANKTESYRQELKLSLLFALKL